MDGPITVAVADAVSHDPRLMWRTCPHGSNHYSFPQEQSQLPIQARSDGGKPQSGAVKTRHDVLKMQPLTISLVNIPAGVLLVSRVGSHHSGVSKTCTIHHNFQSTSSHDGQGRSDQQQQRPQPCTITINRGRNQLSKPAIHVHRPPTDRFLPR